MALAPAPCKAMAAVGERQAAEARPTRPRERVLHNRAFHRPRGGRLHTAAFRIPGNKRRPAPLDDLSNSLLASFFDYPLLSRRVLIGKFPQTRLNLDHQPQV